MPDAPPQVRKSAKLAIAAAILIAVSASLLLLLSRGAGVAEPVGSSGKSSREPADDRRLSFDDVAPLPSVADARSEVTASAAPRSMNILGRVVDRDGQPVERFALVASKLNERNYVVDERKLALAEHPGGKFDLLELPYGRWEIEPLADGRHVEGRPQVEGSNEERVDFEMNRIGVFKVSVRDSNHEPVANAELMVDDSPAQSRMLGPGLFELTLQPAQHRIRVSSPDFVGSEGWWSVSDRSETANMDFVLLPGAIVRGVLVDAGQVPVRGAEIVLSSRREPITTDAAGRFESPHTPAGELEIEVRVPRILGWFTRRIRIPDDEAVELVLELPRLRTVRVEGRLATSTRVGRSLWFRYFGDTTTSLPGRTLALAGEYRARIESDRSFAIDLPMPGVYRIRGLSAPRDDPPNGEPADDDGEPFISIDVPDKDRFEIAHEL